MKIRDFVAMGGTLIAEFTDIDGSVVRLNEESLKQRIENLAKQTPTYDCSSERAALVELQQRKRNLSQQEPKP